MLTETVFFCEWRCLKIAVKWPRKKSELVFLQSATHVVVKILWASQKSESDIPVCGKIIFCGNFMTILIHSRNYDDEEFFRRDAFIFHSAKNETIGVFVSFSFWIDIRLDFYTDFFQTIWKKKFSLGLFQSMVVYSCVHLSKKLPFLW